MLELWMNGQAGTRSRQADEGGANINTVVHCHDQFPALSRRLCLFWEEICYNSGSSSLGVPYISQLILIGKLPGAALNQSGNIEGFLVCVNISMSLSIKSIFLQSWTNRMRKMFPWPRDGLCDYSGGEWTGWKTICGKLSRLVRGRVRGEGVWVLMDLGKLELTSQAHSFAVKVNCSSRGKSPAPYPAKLLHFSCRCQY